MVVLIRNLQKRIVLNTPLILQNANTLVDILRINHFDVNLVFVGKGFIKSLNLRYRRRNVTTDVLAFPYLQVRSSKRKGPFFLVVTIKFSNVQCNLDRSQHQGLIRWRGKWKGRISEKKV